LSEFGPTPAEQKHALNEIFDFVPTAANWRFYFDLLNDRYRRREIIHFCRKLEADAADLVTDPAQSVVDNVERLLVKFSAQNGKSEKSWREIISECHDSFANPYQPGAYINFGLQKLDFATGGIKRTNICTIGAETSGGKTALALQVARNSLLNNLAVAFFSLEMSEEELAERMFAIDGGVSMRAMRKRVFSPDAIIRINDSFARMVSWPCFMSRALSLKEIVARTRQLKVRHDLRLAVVDYLQLVESPHQQTREREVAEVSRALKQLAMELDISVVALTQLNDDGRVRESRAIIHDASIYLGISEDIKSNVACDKEIVVVKNRDGRRGIRIPVNFDGDLMTFTEV
jgi:replicative DNA helicase